MGVLRTILFVIIGYYLIKVVRRLIFVAKSDPRKTEREGSVTVHNTRKSDKGIDVNKASDIEDVDFEEVKD